MQCYLPMDIFDIGEKDASLTIYMQIMRAFLRVVVLLGDLNAKWAQAYNVEGWSWWPK